MPACTVHLLALKIPLPQFLALLHKSSLKPLTIARVIRWIITPTTLSSTLPTTPWDVLLILPNTAPLPQEITSALQAHWFIHAGIPSRLLSDFASKNSLLLHPPSSSPSPPSSSSSSSTIPALTGALEKPLIANSAQELKLTTELKTWIEGDGKRLVPGAVSMLNLLAFIPGMKDSYLKYGAEFSESIGSRRGGEAKIVGTVIHPAAPAQGKVLANGVAAGASDGEKKGGDSCDAGEKWDEVALAHYPTLSHFADMIASHDYQAVNQKYRVPALRDTFILCTSELGLPWPEKGAKL